jgi:cytoskeletal protein RodZ
MRWLFVVFVASLCALLWAAVSVARHVRRNRTQLPAETAASQQEMNQENL